MPHHHAGASFVVSVVYISGRALVLGKAQSFLESVTIILTATILGVVIDADHALWSLVMSPRRCLKYVFTLNVLGLYRELTHPSGYFYERIIVYNKKYPRFFFILHGVWLCLVSLLLYYILRPLPFFKEYLPLFWIVLAVHYISDFIYWGDTLAGSPK